MGASPFHPMTISLTALDHLPLFAKQDKMRITATARLSAEQW
jgi:hypothetical protein